MSQVDKDIEQLIASLDLADEEILKKFSFYLKNTQLSQEEGVRFLDFLREELRKKVFNPAVDQ